MDSRKFDHIRLDRFAIAYLVLEYGRQYFVVIDQNTLKGGSVLPSDGWYDENDSVVLSATANEGWEFANWVGNGQTSSNASAPGYGVLRVNGPVNETAEFDASLTLSTGTNGQLSYSYGSIAGEVDEASSKTVLMSLQERA